MASLTALARILLSVLVTLSGRTDSALKTGQPASVVPSAFFGRKNKRLSLKRNSRSSSSAAAPTDDRVVNAPRSKSTAASPSPRQTANGIPSGPGEVLPVIPIARLINFLLTLQAAGI